MDQQEHISILILAAGNSSRLGKPKQLLPFKGKTLLNHTVDTATLSIAHSVYVVLGFDSDDIRKEISLSEDNILVNDKWQSGMGSSLKHGVSKILEKEKKLGAVLISVCDQPFISTSIFDDLIREYRKTGKIVASGYTGIKGVPAVFPKKYFQEILQLNDDSGANKLLRKYHEELSVLEFAKGEIDIDTPNDLSHLGCDN